MVSSKWVDAIPRLTARLAARGREDANALIVSAWVNLVLASRKYFIWLNLGWLVYYFYSSIELSIVATAVKSDERPAECVAHYKRAISCYEVLLELQPKVFVFGF